MPQRRYVLGPPETPTTKPTTRRYALGAPEYTLGPPEGEEPGILEKILSIPLVTKAPEQVTERTGAVAQHLRSQTEKIAAERAAGPDPYSKVAMGEIQRGQVPTTPTEGLANLVEFGGTQANLADIASWYAPSGAFGRVGSAALAARGAARTAKGVTEGAPGEAAVGLMELLFGGVGAAHKKPPKLPPPQVEPSGQQIIPGFEELTKPVVAPPIAELPRQHKPRPLRREPVQQAIAIPTPQEEAGLARLRDVRAAEAERAAQAPFEVPPTYERAVGGEQGVIPGLEWVRATQREHPPLARPTLQTLRKEENLLARRAKAADAEARATTQEKMPWDPLEPESPQPQAWDLDTYELKPAAMATEEEQLANFALSDPDFEDVWVAAMENGWKGSVGELWDRWRSSHNDVIKALQESDAEDIFRATAERDIAAEHASTTAGGNLLNFVRERGGIREHAFLTARQKRYGSGYGAEINKEELGLLRRAQKETGITGAVTRSKQRGMEADELAQHAYDEGLIDTPYVSELIEKTEKALYALREARNAAAKPRPVPKTYAELRAAAREELLGKQDWWAQSEEELAAFRQRHPTVPPEDLWPDELLAGGPATGMEPALHPSMIPEELRPIQAEIVPEPRAPRALLPEETLTAKEADVATLENLLRKRMAEVPTSKAKLPEPPPATPQEAQTILDEMAAVTSQQPKVAELPPQSLQLEPPPPPRAAQPSLLEETLGIAPEPSAAVGPKPQKPPKAKFRRPEETEAMALEREERNAELMKQIRLHKEAAARTEGAAVGGELAGVESWHNGDRIRYTGKTQTLHGGKFHEFEYLEGPKKGQIGVTQQTPTQWKAKAFGDIEPTPAEVAAVDTTAFVKRHGAEPSPEFRSTLARYLNAKAKAAGMPKDSVEYQNYVGLGRALKEAEAGEVARLKASQEAAGAAIPGEAGAKPSPLEEVVGPAKPEPGSSVRSVESDPTLLDKLRDNEGFVQLTGWQGLHVATTGAGFLLGYNNAPKGKELEYGFYGAMLGLAGPSAIANPAGYYLANLLSRPVSQVVNIIGNSTKLGLNAATTGVGATLARVGVGTYKPGELAASLRGMNMRRAWEIAKQDFIGGPLAREARLQREALARGEKIKVGTPYDRRYRELWGSTANPLNWPGRGLIGMDTFFKELATGARRAQLNFNPHGMQPKEILKNINNYVLDAVFQNDPDLLAQQIIKIKQMPLGQMLEFVIPFVRTRSNLFWQGMRDYTPLGPAWEMGKRAGKAANLPWFDKAAVKTGFDLEEAMIKATIGTAPLVGFGYLAATGQITGRGPSNPNERANWLESGRKPYSMLVDGEWYPYGWIQPLAAPIAAIADGFESYREARDRGDEGKASSVLVGVGNSVVDTVLSQGYLDSLVQFIDAARQGDDPKKMESFLLRTFQNLYPGAQFFRWIQNGFDPVVKDPKTYEEHIKAILPGLANEVPALHGRRGEEIKRPGTELERLMWGAGWAPSPVTTQEKDPLWFELNRLGVGPKMGKTRGEVQLFPGTKRAREATLTDRQKQENANLRARAREEAQLKVINSPYYKNLTDDQKRRRLEHATRRAAERTTQELRRKFQREQRFQLGPVEEAATERMRRDFPELVKQ